MKWCEHCKVHVNTDRKVCPLCFNSLKSDAGSDISIDNKVENDFKTYPSRKIKKKKKSIAYKIFAFLCLVSILTTLVFNKTLSLSKLSYNTLINEAAPFLGYKKLAL